MKTSSGFLKRRLAQGLARLRGNVSQNRFARSLGISNASLNRIENQQQNVALETLETLCLRLNRDIVDLFPPEDGLASPLSTPNLAKQLAGRLRELRGDMSQERFAQQLGIDQATLNRIELEKQNVTLATLQTMCDHLQCTIYWLFHDRN